MALSRKQAREAAFRILFAMGGDVAQDFADVLKIACESELPTGRELEFVQGLVTACVDNLAAIDDIIRTHSRGFAFDRIFKTDLTALRMGIAEVKFASGTPVVVAINEAVEIAKKYGTEKSGGFVNGILAQVI